MDKATKRQRARAKAQLTARNTLSTFEARGLGRKLKSATTFPRRQCSYKIGATKVPVKKRNKNKPKEVYTVMLEVGGVRCPHDATIGQRCNKHLGA